MMTSSFEHVFLFSLLFIVFFLWGKYCSQTEKSIYYSFLLLPILLYAFILGSRYGWGTDYISYKYRFEHAFSYNEDQIGFRLLNQFFNWIGFNYVGGFIAYSLIFIICAFVFVSSFEKEEARYMYILILPATLQLTSQAIRQGLALSFVLLALYFLNKKKWKFLIASFIIGLSIHYSIMITMAMILVFYFFTKKTIPIKLSIPLYLFFTFFFESGRIAIFSPYIHKYVHLNSSYQGYIENADYWFGQNGVNEIYTQGHFTLILSSLFYLAVIYLGYYALKYNPSKKVIYLYNSMVFGIIFYRIVFLFEILRRIAEPLVMFYFVVFGFSIYSLNQTKQYSYLISKLHGFKLPRLSLYKFNFSIVIAIVYLILYIGRFLFLNPEAKFFWNI